MSEKRVTYPLQSWLKAKMEANHWSQEDLAKELGVSRIQITRWMNYRRPNRTSLEMIADRFNEPIQNLMELAGVVPTGPVGDEVRDRIKRKVDQVDLGDSDRARMLNDLLDVWLAQQRRDRE